jgi:hypothetical protein
LRFHSILLKVTSCGLQEARLRSRCKGCRKLACARVARVTGTRLCSCCKGCRFAYAYVEKVAEIRFASVATTAMRRRCPATRSEAIPATGLQFYPKSLFIAPESELREGGIGIGEINNKTILCGDGSSLSGREAGRDEPAGGGAYLQTCAYARAQTKGSVSCNNSKPSNTSFSNPCDASNILGHLTNHNRRSRAGLPDGYGTPYLAPAAAPTSEGSREPK